jgi:hypothetical protein
MSREAWATIYRDAWSIYYTDEHIETVLRRAYVSGYRMRKVYEALTFFSGAVRIEGVHPLQLGIARRVGRKLRRHGMPIVNPLIFYPWRAGKFLAVAYKWLTLYWRYRTIARRIEQDPAARQYTDQALSAPVADPAQDHLVEIFADKIPKTHGAPVREAAAV